MRSPQTEPRDVVITGVGPVTAVGTGADALWTALSEGRSDVVQRTLQVDLGRTIDLPIASMPEADNVPGLKNHFNFLVAQDCGGYRDVAYALLSIELALKDSALEYERAQNNIGVVQAFEAPGVEQTVAKLFGMFTQPPTDGPPPVYNILSPCFYNMQPFVYVHLIGKAFGFHGFSTSVHNACTSGLIALEIAANRIRGGLSDVIIVVAAESFDTGVRLEWFRKLELYAENGSMRPFDAASSGFFVGEGGGAIVLESAEHAARRGVEPYARYLGGSAAQQGWKQVIPDVRSSRLAGVIRDVLDRCGVGASELDLIVPHGAATQLSDGYEAACVKEALGGNGGKAVATAFKPYVGHMLAGSAVIETICTLLAMWRQTVPATLHSAPDGARFPVPLVTTTATRRLKTVLKLSTGFTGHDAAALFRAP